VNQNKKKKPKKAIINALSLIALPVILAALTTMIGFLSFIFGSYLSMIRDFGVLAALGTFYSAVLALVFVPALLSVFPDKRKKAKSKSFAVNRQSIMNKYLLIPLYRLNTTHPKRVISVWVILVLIGVVGIFMIQRSVSVSDYFKYDHPASIADRIMEEKFGGSKPVYVVFTGDMQSPELLKGMYDFENYLLESPYIGGASSIADVVVKLNKALGDEDKIPDDEGKIQQLWFILGQQNLSQLVTEELDQGIIMAKFNNLGQTHLKEFIAYVQTYLDTHETDGYTIEITGMPYVNYQMDKSLVKSQVTSLVIAIILVIAIVSLIFGSFVEGLYAAAPIVATIAILYGIMGLTGIPLNIVTVLVASVAMGIGIDYSIHFISNFNLSLKKRKNLNKAIEDAMLISGKAILINFLSVSIGFLVLSFSDLVPMILFGVLIALSMLGSSMGALTLLPATIIVGKKEILIDEVTDSSKK
jgi:predicted RND superfamily exporter protein